MKILEKAATSPKHQCFALLLGDKMDQSGMLCLKVRKISIRREELTKNIIGKAKLQLSI